MDNMCIILIHNDRFKKGIEEFEMAPNEFTDMEPNEFFNTVSGGLATFDPEKCARNKIINDIACESPNNGYALSYKNSSMRNQSRVEIGDVFEPDYTNVDDIVDYREYGSIRVKYQGTIP